MLSVTPVHVLLAGNVADVGKAAAALSRVLELKSEGLTGRVVISAGPDVGRLVDGNRDALARLIPEFVVPAASPSPGPPGEIELAAAGLTRFDDEDLVLVISLPEPPVWFHFERAIHEFAAMPAPRDSPLRQRIVISGAMPMNPLWMRDQAMLGRAGDLSRLHAAADRTDALPTGLGQAQMRLAAPWVRRLGWLGPFFATAPGLASIRSQDEALRLYGTVLSSPLGLRAIHDTLVILRDGFHLSFLTPADDSFEPLLAATPGATVRRVLGGHPFSGWAGMHYWDGIHMPELFGQQRIGETLALPIHVKDGPSLMDRFGGKLADEGESAGVDWMGESARLADAIAALELSSPEGSV